MNEEIQTKSQAIVQLEFKIPSEKDVKSKKVLTEDEFSKVCDC